MVEQDTIKLLRECDAGIKMGIASIDDVLSKVQSQPFYDALTQCKNEHETLQGEIQQLLGLKDLNRMEAFDISNISGFENVGSMVVYEHGKPKRSDYRKFRIKGVQGSDDYACMEEVLKRRFMNGLREKEKEEVNKD